MRGRRWLLGGIRHVGVRRRALRRGRLFHWRIIGSICVGAGRVRLGGFLLRQRHCWLCIVLEVDKVVGVHRHGLWLRRGEAIEVRLASMKA